mgnify:CR=1 FL=1
MAKNLLITEKPSVAMEFAKVLNLGSNRKNGYIENENWIITWCVGHLVTMSYPEVYDEKSQEEKILKNFNLIDKIKSIIEAVLFACGRPVEMKELITTLELPEEDIIKIIENMIVIMNIILIQY